MSESNAPIDWQEMLKITNNQPDLAKEILNLFVAELPQFKISINQLVEDKSYTNLLEQVHKLHGSCCYCAATTLRSITQTVESQLKSGDHENLEENLKHLNNEIDLVLTYLKEKNLV